MPPSVEASVHSAQSITLDWLLARIASRPHTAIPFDELIAPSWKSVAMARVAVEMAVATSGGGVAKSIVAGPGNRARCLLRDERGRERELTVVFESESSGRIAAISMRPVLGDDIEVRRPTRDDLGTMTELERVAPIQRDDGTEVVIDHNARQFDHDQVVRDHRWLAAFQQGRMVAVQAVAVVEIPIGEKAYRIAYNHYSRSDPRTRNAGNHIHLVATLYEDLFPVIDQFVSIVDVKNTAGLRLSFGAPWPTRTRRLFLSTRELAGRDYPVPARRSFDAAEVAELLNRTHAGMCFWVPRRPEFLLQRNRRAPAVYGANCWRASERAVLALWPSGERRTYRKEGNEQVRTLALALDYGFAGEEGRSELTGLLCEAARELLARDITHIAVFVSDGHPPTEWLAGLAESSDLYAICAPPLDDPPPPMGPIFTDHILF